MIRRTMSTIHEPFAGPIGPSMAEFSGDYMTYVEAHLDEDLKLGSRPHAHHPALDARL